MRSECDGMGPQNMTGMVAGIQPYKGHYNLTDVHWAN
jgi:hypothetical protein